MWPRFLGRLDGEGTSRLSLSCSSHGSLDLWGENCPEIIVWHKRQSSWPHTHVFIILNSIHFTWRVRWMFLGVSTVSVEEQLLDLVEKLNLLVCIARASLSCCLHQCLSSSSYIIHHTSHPLFITWPPVTSWLTLEGEFELTRSWGLNIPYGDKLCIHCTFFFIHWLFWVLKWSYSFK